MSKVDIELRDIEKIIESPWKFESFDKVTTVKIEQKMFNHGNKVFKKAFLLA